MQVSSSAWHVEQTLKNGEQGARLWSHQMANLNFEQPPRSIANASLASRGSGGSTLSSTLAGHVTPTSGMFSGSSTGSAAAANSAVIGPNLSYHPGAAAAVVGAGQPTNHQQQQQQQQQQLSPMNSRNLFGQRAFTGDRRNMPGLGNANPMGGMSGFGIPQNRSYGSQGINNFHSSFGSGTGGGGGDTSTPPLLDLSEFPSLTNRGQGDSSMPQPSPMPGKQPYVGMVKQPTSESSEFTMSSEDFPALPGTQSRDGPSPGGSIIPGDKGLSVGLGPELSPDVLQANRSVNSEKSQIPKKGIQTSSEGKVTNIPGTMVKDQFGMVGLLTFIRAAETDPNLVTLALGQDLTALGLNLNSPDNLHQNFGGPWAEAPCRPQDIDYNVPPEYLINATIRDKLAPVKLNRYKDDLLFYMFYTNAGDVLQLAAAAELYTREWRYHMEEKVWITQAPGLGPVEKTSTYERGTYYYFDVINWRKVPKEFHLEYSKLEGRPHLPNTFHQNQP